MAQKPENRMLSRLKKKLEADLPIEIEKTNNPFRSGRPDWDVFTTTTGQTGYIEGKFWNRQAELGERVDVELIVNRCTELQKLWLSTRASQGHKTAILCGFSTKNRYAFVPYKKYSLPCIVVDYAELSRQIQTWLFTK